MKANFIQKVNYLVTNDLPFALFCLPDADNIQLYYQDDIILHTASSLDFEGFVIAPFDWDKTYKFIPNTKQLTITKTDFLAHYSTDKKPVFSKGNVAEKVQHIALVTKAIQLIQAKKVTKVVCSRVETQKGTLAYLKTFAVMLKTYPFAFNYLFNHPEIGKWQGASPERLLVYENGSLETISLAGTQAFVDQNTSFYIWKQKEKEEQQIVTDYIIAKLKTISDEVSVSNAETALAGKVVHLKSKIKASVKQKTLHHAISLLHPTPAVCGFPTEEAKKFILKNEQYDRSYYTGFFGLVSNDNVQFNVNLRCMKIAENRIHFFIGGGINQGSNPEAEWQETCIKAAVMKEIVVLE